MKTLIRAAFFLLLLSLANVCMAGTITFTVTLGQLPGGGDVANTALGITINNCGPYLLRNLGASPLLYTGNTGFATPDGNGHIALTLQDEKDIGCGSTVASAYVTISIVPLEPVTHKPLTSSPYVRKSDYDLTCDTGNGASANWPSNCTLDLKDMLPRNQPAPASVANALLTNSAGNQSVQIQAGKKITFAGGTLDLTGLTSCLGCGGGGGSATGTGFYHNTAGVLDAVARAIDVSTADITGILKSTSFPGLAGDVNVPAGSVTTTLATVNSNIGTFAKVTVNGKGLVTAATNLGSGDIPNNAANTSGTAGGLSANITESQVTSLLLDLAAKEATANKDVASGYAGLTAGSKLNAAEGQEVWGVVDLSDYASKSGSGTAAIGATLTSLATNDLLSWNGANWVNVTAAAKATALAANGSNCGGSTSFALGVDASGNGECGSISMASTSLTDTANLVRNNASNTYSTGAQDFAAAASLKTPTSAGAAPTANGFVSYDSTANQYSVGVNGVNKKLAFTDSNITGSSASTSGNAATATALAANGTNCSAGSYALGVDASGNAEGCTVAPAGSSVPTGTGFRHVTAGAEDATAVAVNLGTADVQGTLASARFGALTGDVTSAGGSYTTTLANIPNAVPIAGSLLATNTVAPSSPASGKDSIYTDPTDLRLHDKNAAGVIGTTVVSDAGAANNFITAISTAGAISKAQPSFSNISGTATAGQEPATTVNSVVNDTNVTGSISAQALTLGFTGTLAKGRQNSTTMYTDQANTITAGKLTTLASATGGAGLNIPAGVAPTSPAIGDVWLTGTHLLFRDNAGSPATETIFNSGDTLPASQVSGLTSSSVGLGSVTNDAQTKAAIVPNTAPSAAQILIGNAGGTAYAPVSMSQDATMTSAGVVTVTKTNNVPFAASATTDATNATNISSGSLPAGRMPALTGDITSSAGAVATTIASNAVTAAKSAVVLTRRTCVIDNDTQSATALTNAQITGRCDVDAAGTLVEIAVYASGGTPTVLLERWRPNGGTVADLLSATIPTASSGAFACAMSTISQACIAGLTSSGSITISNTSLSAGDVIRVKSATAGGVATWHHIKATWTVN